MMDLFNFFSLKEPFDAFFSEEKPLWDCLVHLKTILSKMELGKIEIKIPPTVFLENKETISIGKGTLIEPGAFIKGPCVIGKNCVIRHGAYIRGGVLTGDDCVIGHATEVKHSILFHGVKAAHFAYIGDSVLGSNVNLGAGVKCANYRLDKENIIIKNKDQKIRTDLKKLGCILGDNVQVGCNTVLSPGTLIGKNSQCYPSIHICGVFEKESKIKKGI